MQTPLRPLVPLFEGGIRQELDPRETSPKAKARAWFFLHNTARRSRRSYVNLIPTVAGGILMKPG